MRYVSTRGGGTAGLDDALVRGIAPDGGLYVPERLPEFDVAAFDDARTLPEVARVMLAPFVAGSAIEDALAGIVDETFSFPIPAVPLGDERASLLELFHGPTAAFKDVGAGFLAAALTRLEGDPEKPLTILVATSGDTGGAVAAAFDGRPGMRVVVLFPEGRVSARQEQQLTCWGDNVLSLRVAGAFDDCQALVKAAFADRALARRYRFSSANSINIGRLLPQATYYADAGLRHLRETGERPGFIIPTGNLGNALACVLAREMGLPVGPVVLATNANRTIADFFETLEWLPRPSVETLASAMDVGDPSNMERLRALLGDAATLRDRLGVCAVDDASIEAEIRRAWQDWRLPLCPHTATALHAWRRMDDSTRAGTHWILAATAHAAKFETIVEPLIRTAVTVPPGLASILSRPSRAERIEPGLGDLGRVLDDRFAG